MRNCSSGPHSGADQNITAYSIMPTPSLEIGRYSIRAVEPSDIENIRCWRNTQIDSLRQSAPISEAQQISYFAREIWPDKATCTPRNILLMFLQDGKPIGYGGLVHIAWEHRRAEISFLLNPEHERSDTEVRDLFMEWVKLMKLLAFKDLNLRRLYTETFATRSLYIPALEKSGFRHEGTLRQHVFINNVAVDSLIYGCLAPSAGYAYATRS